MKRFSYDDETGEIMYYQVNDETGELIMEQDAEFRETINRERDPPAPPPEGKYMKFPRGYISKTKKFKSLKANILAGSNPISHRMLLIPTLMFFPRVFCIMLMVLEIYLHARCHKKNTMLNNPNLYYQSPFHILTSKFCSVCRDCETASKVGQMQDKRRHRYDYIRQIAL